MRARTKIVAVVPAKGRSTRIPGKNLRMLAGKPLVAHILGALQRCSMIDELYLDSESGAIQQLGADLGVDIIDRPPELASDTTNGNDLLLHAADCVQADIYVQAFATAPLLRTETIDAAIDCLLRSPENDSLFTVIRENSLFWDSERRPVNYDPRQLPRGQDLAPFYRETTGLYAIRRQALLARKCRIGDCPILFPVDFVEAVDIDYEHDFRMAEFLAAEAAKAAGAGRAGRGNGNKKAPSATTLAAGN